MLLCAWIVSAWSCRSFAHLVLTSCYVVGMSSVTLTLSLPSLCSSVLLFDCLLVTFMMYVSVIIFSNPLVFVHGDAESSCGILFVFLVFPRLLECFCNVPKDIVCFPVPRAQLVLGISVGYISHSTSSLCANVLVFSFRGTLLSKFAASFLFFQFGIIIDCVTSETGVGGVNAFVGNGAVQRARSRHHTASDAAPSVITQVLCSSLL